MTPLTFFVYLVGVLEGLSKQIFDSNTSDDNAYKDAVNRLSAIITPPTTAPTPSPTDTGSTTTSTAK